MSRVPLAMGYSVGLPRLRLLQHAPKGCVILVLRAQGHPRIEAVHDMVNQTAYDRTGTARHRPIFTASTTSRQPPRASRPLFFSPFSPLNQLFGGPVSDRFVHIDVKSSSLEFAREGKTPRASTIKRQKQDSPVV